MTIRNLSDALTACDLPMPKQAAEWISLRDAIRADDQAAHIQQPDHVIDQMTPKNASDYVDRLVRQRLEVDERRIVVSQLAATAEGRAARAIASEADSLIASYRKRFDTAAKTIIAHAPAFTPDDQAEAVLARGPEAAAAWSAITQASADLDAGLHLWSTLYERPATSATVVATFDGDHWRKVDAQVALESAHRWHALIAAGYTLRLNTLAESLALEDATPERELRYAQTNADGFRGLVPERA